MRECKTDAAFLILWNTLGRALGFSQFIWQCIRIFVHRRRIWMKKILTLMEWNVTPCLFDPHLPDVIVSNLLKRSRKISRRPHLSPISRFYRVETYGVRNCVCVCMCVCVCVCRVSSVWRRRPFSVCASVFFLSRRNTSATPNSFSCEPSSPRTAFAFLYYRARRFSSRVPRAPPFVFARVLSSAVFATRACRFSRTRRFVCVRKSRVFRIRSPSSVAPFVRFGRDLRLRSFPVCDIAPPLTTPGNHRSYHYVHVECHVTNSVPSSLWLHCIRPQITVEETSNGTRRSLVISRTLIVYVCF